MTDQQTSQGFDQRFDRQPPAGESESGEAGFGEPGEGPAPGVSGVSGVSGPPKAPAVAFPSPEEVSRYPCRSCGHVPTAYVSFRVSQGWLVWPRIITYPGPFCRDCGTATFRKSTGSTLLLGWIGGIPFVVAPFILVANLRRYSKVRRLTAPQRVPGQGDWPGKLGRPLDPGRPLYRRVAIVGLAIPVVLVTIFTVGVVWAARQPGPGVGTCVDLVGSQLRRADCDLSHDAVVVKVVERREECPSTTRWVGEHDDELWCLQPD